MESHIVRIDVRRTDEFIFQTIQAIQASGNQKRISVAVIAEKAECHPNTVKTAVKRLRSAGYLDYSPEHGRASAFRILERE